MVDSLTSIWATISLSVQVSWDKIIISGFVSSPLGVASISDVKHKNRSRKFPTDEEVSRFFFISSLCMTIKSP